MKSDNNKPPKSGGCCYGSGSGSPSKKDKDLNVNKMGYTGKNDIFNGAV
jgi:hypothetical protein